MSKAKEQKVSKQKNSTDKPKAVRTTSAAKKVAPPPTEKTSPPPQPVVEMPLAGSRPTFSPKLHLDIQIHISPDSSPEQIDKIFESMAKHLSFEG